MEDPQVLEVLLEEVDEELFQLERQKQSNADNCHSSTNDLVKAEIVKGTGTRDFASVHHVHTPSTRGYTHTTGDWKSDAEQWKFAAEQWKSVAEGRKPVARVHTPITRGYTHATGDWKPAAENWKYAAER